MPRAICRGITSGLSSLASDGASFAANPSFAGMNALAIDATGLVGSGLGVAGIFKSLALSNPLIQPFISFLGDLGTLAQEMKNTFNSFISAAGPVRQAQSLYLALVKQLKAAYFAYIQANHTCPPNPPPPPTPPNPNPGPTRTTTPGAASDPNDLTTTGYGPQNFVSLSDAITYTIDFENEPTASAAAQQVVITDQLPTTLDWSTVQLTSIAFNGVTLTPQVGVSDYQGEATVATDPSHPVDVNVTFDPQAGLLTWTMTSIDPLTDKLSEDPLAGFLPPDNAQQQGEGLVTFTVQPLSGLTTTTAISNQAKVVFDLNAPINTPTVVNTIDSGMPSSSVILPAYSATPNFTVAWAGQDDAGGSGIASFNVFVSDNNGPWQLWQNATPALSAVYPGQVGHTYGFYSVATDNVGNQQATPASAQASITVPVYQPTASEYENGTPTPVVISTLLTGHYSDPDGSANSKQGIAIVQVGGNGIWQYSTNGTAWTTIGTVLGRGLGAPQLSPTHALLLSAADSLKFTPAANWNGQANLFFLAWDGSQGKAGGTANASSAGGTTAFSVTAGDLALTVSPVPQWVGTGAHLTSIAPGVYNPPSLTNPAGNTIASVFASYFQDSKPAVSVGVAVVSVPATNNGLWQFSTNGGGTWTTIPGRLDHRGIAAVINRRNPLRAQEHLRRRRFAHCLAWDGSVGIDGKPGNPAKLGTQAFSPKTLTAAVAPVNHAHRRWG